MANILYGVNGEGAGHSTRAKEVLSHLVVDGNHGEASLVSHVAGERLEVGDDEVGFPFVD